MYDKIHYKKKKVKKKKVKHKKKKKILISFYLSTCLAWKTIVELSERPCAGNRIIHIIHQDQDSV